MSVTQPDSGISTSSEPPPTSPALHAAILERRPKFLANRWRDLETMRGSIERGDFETVRRLAHNCKGNGRGYGFPEISDLGARMEQSAKAGDLAATSELIESFEQVLRREATR